MFFYDHPTKGHQLIIDTIANSLWRITNRKDTTVAEYSRTLWTQDKKAILKAYEYIIDKGSQDGEVVLYISPQLGIISEQSLVWRNGSYLKHHPNSETDLQPLLYFLGLNYPYN